MTAGGQRENKSLGLEPRGAFTFPQPSPLNHHLLSLLFLPRISILQPTSLTVSAMPWTPCIERWVAQLRHGGGEGGWGREGAAPSLSRGRGLLTGKPHCIWNQPRRIPGLTREGSVGANCPPNLYLGHSLGATAG